MGAAFSTPICGLIRIKPKETNEQSAQDGDCDHILPPTELNLVNASGTEGASSRRSFCDAQPDSVSTPLCHRAANGVALRRRSARSDSGMAQLIGLQFVIFTTSSFLRRSMNSMALRSGRPPAERQVTEPFAPVIELSVQI